MAFRPKKKSSLPQLSFRMKTKAMTLFAALLYFFIITLFVKTEEIPALQAAQPVAIYSNQAGDDLKKVTLQAIANARESISILIYSLTDADVIALLRKRANEGIQVHVVHDAAATPDLSFRLGPLAKVSRWRGRGLMHHKIVVIDHETVWWGSTNLTRESLQLHANMMLGLYSPDFARISEEKVYSMIAGTKCAIEPVILKTAGQSVEFFYLPEQNESFDKLLRCIGTAKKSVKVAMYTFTHPKLTDALVAAQRRGVDVQVVVDNESSKQTSKKVFVHLKREGIKVAASKRSGLLHHKMAIIDDETLITGSANWTKAAFQTNDDSISFISPLDEVQKKKVALLWKTVLQQSHFRSISVAE